MTILCYHAIDPDWRSPLSVSPEQFEAHCAWLARHRRVVGAAEAAVRVALSGRLPRGRVAITFDDGFRSVHRYAFPILVRHRLPATVFLVAQRISAVLTADVIVVLEEGRIVAKGGHKELLASSPEYRSIYESQLGPVPA